MVVIMIMIMIMIMVVAMAVMAIAVIARMIVATAKHGRGQQQRNGRRQLSRLDAGHDISPFLVGKRTGDEGRGSPTGGARLKASAATC
jgi:anionic cell wall polymer biosynthesis LytR-Cps2A-Psr (LCP) family protein